MNALHYCEWFNCNAGVAGKADVRDVFISYCWAQKDTVLRIKDRLEDAGLNVWFDEKDMCT